MPRISTYIRSNSVRHFILVFILAVSILVVFKDLPQAYFEQDEWHTFNRYNYLLSLNQNEFIANSLKSGPLSHFTPLSLFSKMEMYQVFRLQASGYFYISILLHFFVVLSVYLLLYGLFKNKLSAFLGSMFLAVNSSHHQAITWIGTFEGTEGAVLFGIWALITWILYVESGKIKLFYLSLILILIGLLFKETAVTFFLVIVIFSVIHKKSINKIKSIFSLSIVLFTYLILRFNYLITGQGSFPSIVAQGDVNITSAFLYNLFLLPLKIFAIDLLPNPLIIDANNALYSVFKNWRFAKLLQLKDGFFYDILTVSVGIFIVLLFLFVWRKNKNNLQLNLGFAIIILTAAPFILFRKYLVFFDSRYLYPATVGISILLPYWLNKIKMDFKPKNIAKLGLFIILILIHSIALKGTIYDLVKIGTQRQMILNQILEEYPGIPEKVIFYTESNTAYYGMPDEETIMPFQSGFGEVLLTVYFKTEKFPTEFLEDDYLWGIKDQDCKVFNNRGFGYFRNFELLKKGLEKCSMLPNSVIAYSWDGETGQLKNITNQIKGKLERSNE